MLHHVPQKATELANTNRNETQSEATHQQNASESVYHTIDCPAPTNLDTAWVAMKRLCIHSINDWNDDTSLISLSMAKHKMS